MNGFAVAVLTRSSFNLGTASVLVLLPQAAASNNTLAMQTIRRKWLEQLLGALIVTCFLGEERLLLDQLFSSHRRNAALFYKVLDTLTAFK